MPPRKLSPEDKISIVNLYRESGQTTGTVAEQYGVSVSTISRLLKSELPADEYDALVKQKRGGGREISKKESEKSKGTSRGSVRSRRTVKKSETIKKSETVKKSSTVKKSETVKKKTTTVKKSRSSQPEIEIEAAVSSEQVSDSEQETLALEPTTETPKPTRRRRRRSRVKAAEPEVIETVQLELAEPQQDAAVSDEPEPSTWEKAEADEASSEATLEADDLDTVLSVVADDDFEDDFDDDIDEDGEVDNSDEDALEAMPSAISTAAQLEILPIANADLERMLYLVIDRTADLITCPMQEFRDLGQVPSEEEKLATLPIFDNHRIARRFSKRNQRVIKVPDGRLLAKTAPWLEAKGITRCLLDGQVYSLESGT